MAYRISTTKVGRRTVYGLHDDATGASASVLPSFGFNLFDLRLPLAGKPRRVVVAAPDFPENPKDAGRNGIPILFPYPNRVANARYSFEGKDYKLPVNSGANSIHGFAIQADWDVVEHKAETDAAVIVGRYQLSKQSADVASTWPADAILQVRYRLAGRRLTLDATITNPSVGSFPFGFGIHPYFALPFDPPGDQSKTEVILPASKFWKLEGFLPTGEQVPPTRGSTSARGNPSRACSLTTCSRASSTAPTEWPPAGSSTRP